MPPRDLRPVVIPDSGISPFEAAILVPSWTTVTPPGALGVWPQHGPDGGWLYGRAGTQLRDLRSELGNDVPPLYREHQTGVAPVEEFFIRSVFVRHRLRLAAEAFFETRAAIFRMPQGILGDAEPALRRLRSNLALLVLGRTYRPLRQPARIPAQRMGSYVLELAQQGRVSLHTSLDPDLHLRMPQIRQSDEDDFESSDLEDDVESLLAGSPPFSEHDGAS